MGVRGLESQKVFCPHALNIWVTSLDVKICPFLDRKEQLHLLFQSYLPIYCFFADVSVSHTPIFYHWGVCGCYTTAKYYHIGKF